MGTIIQVTEDDFEHARATVPRDAPRWMLQEFAANHALKRVYPDAGVIKVDASGIQVDYQRFCRPLGLYLHRGPYAFNLSRVKLLVVWYDLAHLLGRLTRGRDSRG